MAGLKFLNIRFIAVMKELNFILKIPVRLEDFMKKKK